MRVLREAIEQGRFAPAYYLIGDDEFFKSEWLDRLTSAAVDSATRDFNLDQRRGAEVDAETLASLLGAPPMMAARRVVVIRDVTGLRKDARQALDAYLASPAPDTLVVMTAPAGARDDKGLSSRAVTVDFKPLTGGQVAAWIKARATERGVRLSGPAASLLQGAVGDDVPQLAIELEKLAAYCGDREIDEAAVAAVVGVRREETLGGLLDAVAARDAETAVALLGPLLQRPKSTGVFVVMALTTQFLAIAAVTARGVPASRRSGEFFNLLRRGGSNVAGRPWGEAASAWTRASPHWSAAELDRALAILLQADLALKSSRLSSEEQVLSSAILTICAGGARRDAA
jgi:DNA polymerase-3 subunit delta